jgi:predicted Ser/Thr protein kinase
MNKSQIPEKVREEAQHFFEVYIDNVMGYLEKKKVAAWWEGQQKTKLKPPNEAFMRAIEENANIPTHGADDFRRQLMAFIGQRSLNGNQINWTTTPMVKDAILFYLAEKHPEWVNTPEPTPKYRSIADAWEPAW